MTCKWTSVQLTSVSCTSVFSLTTACLWNTLLSTSEIEDRDWNIDNMTWLFHTTPSTDRQTDRHTHTHTHTHTQKQKKNHSLNLNPMPRVRNYPYIHLKIHNSFYFWAIAIKNFMPLSTFVFSMCWQEIKHVVEIIILKKIARKSTPWKFCYVKVKGEFSPMVYTVEVLQCKKHG